MSAIPPDLVRTRLTAARVARLATVDERGDPHVVPVCFAFDGSRLYSAIDRKPKHVVAERLARVRHVTRHPAVAVIVDEYDEDWRRLWYVLVRGPARLLAEPDVTERTQAIALLRAKYVQYRGDLLPEDALVIRVTADRITTWSA